MLVLPGVEWVVRDGSESWLVVTMEGFGRPSVPTAEKSLVNRPIVVPVDVLQSPPWSYSGQNDASVFMTNRLSLVRAFVGRDWASVEYSP
ncbi:hypothetical protein AVEN_244921-1 [Araneus ventricosus]|uniref:Uncharacterized protein n=1 Tax=Araneus ventricosus TaxID=182803 RepID=A0A4Y2R041_ARAVE|nr:hypothetical protein AVEN_244921-1 [Araneus ventricosus]